MRKILTWTCCLRKSCAWRSDWSRSCRRRIWSASGRSRTQSRWMNEKRTWRSQKQTLTRPRFSGASVPGWGTRTRPVSFWETWIGARGPSTRLPAWTGHCPAPWHPCPSLVARAGGSGAAGTGALACPCPCRAPCPCPGPGPCPGPCAACPSHPSSLVPAPVPTLLSAAAAPCRAPVPAPVRAPAGAAPVPALVPAPVPAPVVCSLFPFPVLALFP